MSIIIRMNTKRNSTNINIAGVIFFIIILIIIFIVVYLIINKSNIIVKEKGIKQYDYPYPKSFVSNYLKKCPLGCIRGVCRRMNNGQTGCKYDYQCSYCTDRHTKRFFVDFGNRNEIIPVYEEQKKLLPKQSNTLNNQIKENNEYINELNEEIEYRNNQ